MPGYFSKPLMRHCPSDDLHSDMQRELLQLRSETEEMRIKEKKMRAKIEQLKQSPPDAILRAVENKRVKAEAYVKQIRNLVRQPLLAVFDAEIAKKKTPLFAKRWIIDTATGDEELSKYEHLNRDTFRDWSQPVRDYICGSSEYLADREGDVYEACMFVIRHRRKNHNYSRKTNNGNPKQILHQDLPLPRGLSRVFPPPIRAAASKRLFTPPMRKAVPGKRKFPWSFPSKSGRLRMNATSPLLRGRSKTSTPPTSDSAYYPPRDHKTSAPPTSDSAYPPRDHKTSAPPTSDSVYPPRHHKTISPPKRKSTKSNPNNFDGWVTPDNQPIKCTPDPPQLTYKKIQVDKLRLAKPEPKRRKKPTIWVVSDSDSSEEEFELPHEFGNCPDCLAKDPAVFNKLTKNTARPVMKLGREWGSNVTFRCHPCWVKHKLGLMAKVKKNVSKGKKITKVKNPVSCDKCGSDSHSKNECFLKKGAEVQALYEGTWWRAKILSLHRKPTGGGYKIKYYDDQGCEQEHVPATNLRPITDDTRS